MSPSEGREKGTERDRCFCGTVGEVQRSCKPLEEKGFEAIRLLAFPQYPRGALSDCTDTDAAEKKRSEN